MNKINILFLIVYTLISSSCDRSELPYSELSKKTIIVYMAADNDLSYDAIADIEEMKQGFPKTKNNLIVFADINGKPPYLLKIDREKGTVIKSYPELDSTDPTTLAEITKEVIRLYPAEEYGLILWSHGTSWLPAAATLRSFGKDAGSANGSGMNIPELAKSLPAKFDFIIMDACLMGAVEVAYELRSNTDLIIASSTETIANGFPYDEIIPELMEPVINYQSVAKHYYDYYNNMSGAYRSATISVVNTHYLEALSHQLKLLFESNNAQVSLTDRESIQHLDIYEEQYAFDLLDFVKNIFTTTDVDDFINILNQVVIYKAHTPMFLSKYKIKTYCGLSSYIPDQEMERLNLYYKTLEWYNAAGIYNLF